MGILSKHLNTGEPIKIGEDTIHLKALTTDSMPLFFKAMKTFGSIKEDNPEVMFQNMDDDSLNAIKEIIEKTLAISLPDEPEEDRKTFGMKYMMILLPHIMEINMQNDQSHEKVKKMDTLKKLQLEKAKATENKVE